MNRIFHARIVWYQYFLLVVLGVNAFGFLWCKNIILATLMMLFLIVVIEQIIHTVYTVTADGLLLLNHGRFIRKNSYCRNYFYPESPFYEIRKFLCNQLSIDRIWKREICFCTSGERKGIYGTD